MNADLSNTQLKSKYNKGTQILLCIIGIFNKYAWVVPFKEKKRYHNY